MSATAPRHAAASGVALMVLSTGAFSVMSAQVKALGPGFPFFEALFFRALLSLPLLFWALRRSGVTLHPRRPGLMLLRGLLGLAAMSCHFYATQRGKLADILIISRFEPILVALLAPALLGERAPGPAAVALAAGLGGVLLVIRPGLTLLALPGLVAFAATLFSSLAHLAVRRLNAVAPPWLIVTWFVMVTCLGGGLLAIPGFVAPAAGQWLLLAGISLTATSGQILMTTAYSRDTAPVVSAASYSYVVFGIVLGYAIWGEMPDGLALVGGAIIVAAGVYLAWTRRTHHEAAGVSS